MKEGFTMNATPRSRLLFTRPLYLSILLATTIELINFIIFGFLLPGEGSLLEAFLWTVAIGGIGLGSVLGVLIDIVVIGNTKSKDARWLTVMLSALTLGLVAKLFTLNMGESAQALGVAEWPVLYVVAGVVLSIVGGALLGWLLFTKDGNQLLERYNF